MILGILQARTSSSRLPAKVLAELQGEPMLARQLERLARSRRLERLVVATSDEASDDAIHELCRARGVACYRGSLDDVLGRFLGAAEDQGVDFERDTLVRATGDCPLCDPQVIDAVIAAHLERGADYTSNALERTYPDGLDIEVMRAACLERAAREASLPSEREHVTSFFYRRPEEFVIESLTHTPDLSHLRLTVDRPEDLALVRAVYARLYPLDPAFGLEAILDLARREPELFAGNAAIDRREGYERSLAADERFLEGEGR